MSGLTGRAGLYVTASSCSKRCERASPTAEDSGTHARTNSQFQAGDTFNFDPCSRQPRGRLIPRLRDSWNEAKSMTRYIDPSSTNVANTKMEREGETELPIRRREGVNDSFVVRLLAGQQPHAERRPLSPPPLGNK